MSNKSNNNQLLEVCGESGIEQWSALALEKLGFSKAEMSSPTLACGKGGIDTFRGSVQLDEFNNRVIMVKVDSSPQKISLTHQDSLTQAKNKIIFLHTYSGINITSAHQTIYIPRGENIIIPAWEPYVETCLKHRSSLSFIIDIDSICCCESDVSPFLWTNLSAQGYGDMLNSLALRFYNNPTTHYSERLIKTMLDVLSLQFDNFNCKKKENKDFAFAMDDSVFSIQDVIRSNLKNKNFSLSDLSKYYDITPRAIQYKLKKHNIKFLEYLNKQRSELLANKIVRQPNDNVETLALECGFKTMAVACRFFKSNYNITPAQYKNAINKRRN
ncbi:helix-turn-helix domain-containing protein [Edwardsiella piscicida]|nr:helix-turn-helix domain-containing protein [Edwardsiella piscicida]